MLNTALELSAAAIARLTPNTPPALWIPYVGYAAVAIGAIAIAVATRMMSGSRIAAAAAAIGFIATWPFTDGIGPLMIALTILGIVAMPRNRLPPWLLLGLVVPSFVFTHNGGLFAWCLVGCGLQLVGASVESVASVPAVASTRWPRVWGTALIVILLLIIVTAPLPANGRSEPPLPAPLGHNRATVNSFRAVLSNIPTGAALIRDDATTNILFRATERDFRRARVYIKPINNIAADIRNELPIRRVFALPHAQASLQLQGFQIVDSLHLADHGLAEVVAGGDCVSATNEWQATISLTDRRDLAFVVDRESRRGPVVMYLAGTEPIHVSAVNWPARTLRGFSPRTFDLTKAQDRQDLERQRTEDDGPWTMDLSGRSSVTRVALWRMPDSALAMPIKLSAAPTYAAVKLSPEADRPVSVCPVFPATVSAIR